MYRIAVIPVQMGATRYPGKPLKEINGMAMVEHIYHRAKMAGKLDDVFIGTPDQEIVDFVEGFGGKAYLSKSTNKRATECVADVVAQLEKKPDITIMVQGDEPMIRPDQLDNMIDAFEKFPDASIVNLTNAIGKDDEYADPHIVKLVHDKHGKVLWFFRRPNPTWQDAVKELSIQIQTGIIGFRGSMVTDFNTMAPTGFELQESVDMFRVLEHGHGIQTVLSDVRLYSVDTPEDRDFVSEKMKDDDLVSQYT